MVRLSEEEANLPYLFASYVCEREHGAHDKAFGCGLLVPFVDRFIESFDADPTKWRAEIAPARQVMTDERDG